MKDREVVDAFVAHLQGYPKLLVDRRPDEDNRESPDIDAIAGPYAIEHTSIDALPNQRRDADWFMRVVGGVEQELATKLLFRLNVTLEYDAVVRGQNWDAVRVSLKRWVANDAPELRDGTYILEGLAGIPFRLHVRKLSNRRAGVYFARGKPNDYTLSERVRGAFERKASKLAKYHDEGKTTILLVENGDIALMNEWAMLEAIRAAYPKGLPARVDEVWYADTSCPSEIEFHDFTALLG